MVNSLIWTVTQITGITEVRDAGRYSCWGCVPWGIQFSGAAIDVSRLSQVGKAVSVSLAPSFPGFLRPVWIRAVILGAAGKVAVTILPVVVLTVLTPLLCRAISLLPYALVLSNPILVLLDIFAVPFRVLLSPLCGGLVVTRLTAAIIAVSTTRVLIELCIWLGFVALVTRLQ